MAVYLKFSSQKNRKLNVKSLKAYIIARPRGWQLFLDPYVEPAVNRQPGYRRGAVEQSMADTSTATSQEN